MVPKTVVVASPVPSARTTLPQRSPHAVSNKNLGHYILGKTIGEGTFGKVKLGRHILTGERVAVKVLEKERIQEVADIERVAREVQLLKLIRHPHVVQLYEIIETKGQLYLIMEYASGGELFDYIVQNQRVPEPEACRFFHQIIAGVEKIHAMNVVHRDLKPENLLLDEHRCIKIVDFGLSNRFNLGQLLKTACGSPCYAPPEMVSGQNYVPQMCDLWSCGVILFAMVCGFLPFEDSNTSALYKKILAANYSPPSFISESVKELIAGLLTVDPSARFTIADVRGHPWYQQISEASVRPKDLVAGQCGLDEDVLQELKRHGFPREYAINCLQNNKHNSVTTTYYLLAAKRKRMMDHLQRQEERQEERDRAASPSSRPGASSRGSLSTPQQRMTPQESRDAQVTPNSSRMAVTPDTSMSRPAVQQTTPNSSRAVVTHDRPEPSTPNSSRMVTPDASMSLPRPAVQVAMPTSPYLGHERDEKHAVHATPEVRFDGTTRYVIRPVNSKVARSSTVPVSQRPAPSTPRQPMSSRPTSSPKQEERFTVVEVKTGLDEEVLQELKQQGIPRDYAISCLQGNKQNSITATYHHLLAAKRRRTTTPRGPERATSPSVGSAATLRDGAGEGQGGNAGCGLSQPGAPHHAAGRAGCSAFAACSDPRRAR
eukprot:CAMPEP_0181525444 /NCGR_PEP_ID=MMETSP1110-20121109/68971_1 /TAXON_ID=174948 /ORGANISM="Symbiodinium sp., Strain CCMP421" /LENGTH=657 /DNA_ID=CAMNT_0023656249 /DNA_START=111 /DNA_END=2081 /DNA_ORIENTATION=+